MNGIHFQRSPKSMREASTKTIPCSSNVSSDGRKECRDEKSSEGIGPSSQLQFVRSRSHERATIIQRPPEAVAGPANGGGGERKEERGLLARAASERANERTGQGGFGFGWGAWGMGNGPLPVLGEKRPRRTSSTALHCNGAGRYGCQYQYQYQYGGTAHKIVLVTFMMRMVQLKPRLEFATFVPYACQSGSLARARSSSPDLAEISIWFLAVTVHGRPKGQSRPSASSTQRILKMIIIFYRRLPTATLAIIHQITALEVGANGRAERSTVIQRLWERLNLINCSWKSQHGVLPLKTRLILEFAASELCNVLSSSLPPSHQVPTSLSNAPSSSTPRIQKHPILILYLVSCSLTYSPFPPYKPVSFPFNLSFHFTINTAQSSHATLNTHLLLPHLPNAEPPSLSLSPTSFKSPFQTHGGGPTSNPLRPCQSPNPRSSNLVLGLTFTKRVVHRIRDS
ncbi:hypothetical protein NA56DRAFT_709790 [Hyaloscypha hepaticicola]|uniref:Uncharacterized protein n=1 Tax=Hyaloscypha hepaticicola TaxID=2082293 RepID=A0A2J6PMV6_9HELO|nr:hypothetical protein NA56DRAFT_709790 [Hyaloscypha hepaticicola]